MYDNGLSNGQRLPCKFVRLKSEVDSTKLNTMQLHAMQLHAMQLQSHFFDVALVSGLGNTYTSCTAGISAILKLKVLSMGCLHLEFPRRSKSS